MKHIVSEKFCHHEIKSVNFDVLSADEIARYGEIEVLNCENYDLNTRLPMPLGSLDPRLGCGDKGAVCGTCQQRVDDCNGHFGHVRLVLPVYHVGFLRHTHTILQCLCKRCGRALMPPQDHARYIAKLRRPNLDDHGRASLHKKIVEACKKVKQCPYCQQFNAQLKKGSGVPLSLKHALAASNKSVPNDIQVSHEESFEMAKEANKDLQNFLDKAHDDVNPQVAYNLLRLMPAMDRELMGCGAAERMMITSLPVPPVCIRPSVGMGDAGVAQDDLTAVISDIVTANNSLREQLAKGTSVRSLQEGWFWLQENCARYVNSEAAGLTNPPKGKPIRSICTRLKGKEGRFRGNLSGKRVDFSGRTVISPDPNVSVEQVVVPLWVARRMTYPERVCEANIERLRAAIRTGPEEHPGACFTRSRDGRGKFLGALNKNFRRQVADRLRPGDLVERHMIDGDVVLFNRQPSLHRLSIMAHRAKVMPGRTLRFNECVCAPYNADFDGDEMNIHMPQTEEARAEAIQLMGVRQGLVTPKSGEVAVCATQDFLTASWLLTQKDVFLTRDKFCQLCASMTDGNEHIELPPPAILKPVELWTGKQMYSVMLKPNRKTNVLVNLELAEKNYTKKGESMCRLDGWVIFRNSELITGNVGKKVLGGAKNGFFFRLIRDNSAQAAVACMSRLAKVTSRWLMNRGMTIGIDDICAPERVLVRKKQIIDGIYDVVNDKIGEYREGRLPLKPGCTAEQTLEALVNGELGRVRDQIGGMCEETLTFMNKPRIMAQCGSKGSPINLCQMMACLGQQNVGGQRIKDGFVNRTLPHFQKGSKEPKARGFVANSFYSGLEAPEFFFHTMGGREGLVDTAVKTAETGYMQRRLIKALEDLSLKYDLTVRTSAGEVVQFAYGDDGMNPARMEGSSSKPLDYDTVLRHVEYVSRPPRTVRDGRVCSAWHLQQQAGEAGPKAKRRRLSSAGEPAAQDTKALAQCDSPTAALPLPPVQPHSKTAIQRSQADMNLPGYRLRSLLPIELKELAMPCAERFVEFVRRTHGGAELELSHMLYDISGYIKKLATSVAEKRRALMLEPGDTADSARAALAATSREENLSLADMGLCPTQAHLEMFVNRCAMKYVQAMLMPGEAVGAVAAQSIGEPATQMTLKTFHFAGVASMNVTLGVPRIKEIINAAKTISTPIITCALVDEHSEVSARIVKGRIERVALGDVCFYMKEVYDPIIGCFISVKIDMETIRKLQLEVSMRDIKEALLDHKNVGGIRLAPSDVEVVPGNKIRVYPPGGKSKSPQKPMLFFELQELKLQLPDVSVHGIRTTVRTVINKNDKATPTKYHLLVEGYGLRDVMSTPGILGPRTKTNHVAEVEQVLGIEAARRTIMSEISETMAGHGIAVDARHIQMLGDCMTYRGVVLGINRYGISKMRSSALYLASFERTTDHIFDAAAHRRVDPVTGVSECIILGSQVKLGTGLFKILYDYKGRQPAANAAQVRRTPLLNGWQKPGQALVAKA